MADVILIDSRQAVAATAQPALLIKTYINLHHLVEEARIQQLCARQTARLELHNKPTAHRSDDRYARLATVLRNTFRKF
jgi:hypothetical protein